MPTTLKAPTTTEAPAAAETPERGSIPNPYRGVLDMPFVPEEERLELRPPGGRLREDFLEPFGLTSDRAATLLGIQQTRLGEILAGKRGISADTALRLGRLFGLRAEYFLELKARYDLQAAKYAPGAWASIQRIDPLDPGGWSEPLPEEDAGSRDRRETTVSGPISSERTSQI